MAEVFNRFGLVNDHGHARAFEYDDGATWERGCYREVSPRDFNGAYPGCYRPWRPAGDRRVARTHGPRAGQGDLPATRGDCGMCHCPGTQIAGCGNSSCAASTRSAPSPCGSTHAQHGLHLAPAAGLSERGRPPAQCYRQRRHASAAASGQPPDAACWCDQPAASGLPRAYIPASCSPKRLSPQSQPDHPCNQCAYPRCRGVRSTMRCENQYIFGLSGERNGIRRRGARPRSCHGPWPQSRPW
jgi:hypothetical protein